MESLSKLRGSIMISGINSGSYKPHAIYVAKMLRDVAKDYPNDADLGREIRKISNTVNKFYNI